MRQIAIIILVAAGLAACHGSSPVEGVSAPAKDCARRSWVAGSSELCDGRLIYRDYVYDDYGADGGVVSPSPVLLNLTTRGAAPFPTTPGALSPTAGDVRYPAGLENTADLVALTLAIEGEELVARFELNTLYHADDAIAALAIDSDNDAATGGGSWEGLGIASSGWEQLQTFAAGDPATNLITGRMPLPPGATWRVQAVVAQKDGQVMNVAFRGVDEEAKADGGADQVLPGSGNFWEDRQAAALAAGDISGFSEVVRVADLRGGVTRAAPAVSGFHQRVYTSAYTLGEGVNLDGVPGRHGDTGLPCEQYFHYLGKYQPYGIYIPAGGAALKGAQLVMHGCQANHASQINQPGMQQQFGEALNRILIAPLGRGPVGFYSDLSERDVLDTLADVRANYAVDDEQVFASGYSMGGYGAMRLAALYPDLFAGMVNWVGFSGDISNTPLPGNPLPAALLQLAATLGAAIPQTSTGGVIGGIGNVIDLLGNLRHIPSANLYAGADELVQSSSSLAIGARYGELEVPYKFFFHPVAEHLTFMALDDWQKEAAVSAGLRRVRNPARVSYRTDASFDFPEYAIRHDRAYWVSQIVAEAPGYSDVDLTSLGCGAPQPTYATGQDAGPAPIPWAATLRTRIDGLAAPAAEPRLAGTLRNIRSLTLDAAGSCLGGRSVSYQIDSDVPVILRLSDGRSLALPAGGGSGTF